MSRLRAFVGPLIILSLFGAAVTLEGCGGGGSSTENDGIASPKGRVQVQVTWPKSSTRAIPSNAQSIKLVVKDGTTVVGSTIIVRPASTATINDVPVGALSVEATAYSSNDGTGIALATATVPAIVLDNATSNVNLTLASTIDHLEYSPNPFIVGAGTSLGLIVTAKDSSGNSVMLDPAALSYTVSDPSLFTVAPDGTVTANALLGLGTIRVTEANSGKDLTIAAGVSLGILVTPPTAVLNVNGSTTFSAIVVGNANNAVTWSVRESNGGTITPSGLYTAPTHRGSYHVEATSVADSTRKVSVLVTVTAGSINAGVN